MKKILAFILCIIIVFCFVSCNTNQNTTTPTSEQGTEKNIYKVTVTGSKDSLMEKIEPSYKAGTVVQIKAYPVTDITLRVFVNGKEISMSHWDSNYWGFEFVMPEEDITIHLTYDQFYGRDEYTFAELHWNSEAFEKGISKVAIKTIDYADKTSFIVINYSFKQEDIDKFKAILEQKLMKVDNNTTTDATLRTEFMFYADDFEQNLLISPLVFYNDFLHWNDFSAWQAFRFKDESYSLPTIEIPDFVTYAFQYDGRSSDVKKNDDESFSIKYFSIGSVEFIPYEGDSFVSDSPFYLDSRYGKIHLLSETIFELNGEYYEIISGVEYWAYIYLDLENK